MATVGTILPDTIRNGETICFRPVWQDVWIYIDGELRAEHDLKDSRPYGKNSAFKYVFVELNEEDAGKELIYKFTSGSKYSGVIRQMYYGERSSIWVKIMADAGPKSAAALSMGYSYVHGGCFRRWNSDSSLLKIFPYGRVRRIGV